MYTINLLDRSISDDRSSATAENGQLLNVVRNPFICSRCSKAFPTVKALGGHQNAHRRERDKERWNSTEQHRRKAKEIPSEIPKPPGDGQISDFWAKHFAKPAELSSHGDPFHDKNEKSMANSEMDGYVERDFMGTIVEQGGDSWLGELPVAIPVTFGGGKYGSDELDLTLKL